VNLNCVTNRVAQGPRYKLSYDAEQYKNIHTLLKILYLQPLHTTVRQHSTHLDIYNGPHVSQDRLSSKEEALILIKTEKEQRLLSEQGHAVALDNELDHDENTEWLRGSEWPT
jgi:hypothetical protein